MFEREKRNKNNMSYWLEKVKDTGFAIPETYIHTLPDKWSQWLISETSDKGLQKEFNRHVEEVIKSCPLAEEEELFMKTGVFSNKFCFPLPHLKRESFYMAGSHFTMLTHVGMRLESEVFSPEIVLRKFIHTSYERPSVYGGMKLNTEFRVFYDFNTNEICGLYRHNSLEEYSIKRHMRDNIERDVFEAAAEAIENDFQNLKGRLQEECEKNLPKADGLYDIWAIDFLWDGNKFWLIDMAFGFEGELYCLLGKNELPEKDYIHIYQGDKTDYYHGWIYYPDKTVPIPVFESEKDCMLWSLSSMTKHSMRLEDFQAVKILPYADRQHVLEFFDTGSFLLAAEAIIREVLEQRHQEELEKPFCPRYRGMMRLDQNVSSENIVKWVQQLKAENGILTEEEQVWQTKKE